MSTTDGDPEEVPRQPSAYYPSIHFGQQKSDAGTDLKRHIDGDIIEGCIRDGRVEQQTATTYHFQETFGGVTYRLVINVKKREVVTGFPIGINTDVARESPRWSASQIEDVQEFLATDPRTTR